MTHLKTLGINLKKARKSCNLRAKEVANLLGISPSALSNYEAGIREPSLQTIWSLAHLYHVTADQLLEIGVGQTLEPLQGKAVTVYDSKGNEAGKTYVSKFPMEGRYFAVSAWDNSMNGMRICKGDTVVCRAVKHVELPGIYLFRQPEAMIRYAQVKNGDLILTPHNNEGNFRTERIPIELAEVAGQVVEVKIKI